MVHERADACDTSLLGCDLRWTTNKQEHSAVARPHELSITCSVCHDSNPAHLPLISQVDGRQACPLHKSSSRQCQAASPLNKANYAARNDIHRPGDQASVAATV